MVIKMIELKQARKLNPLLYVNWVDGTVTNMVTLIEGKIKMIKVGKEHYAYIPEDIV